MMVFLVRDFVISVRHSDHSSLHDVRRLGAGPEQLALAGCGVARDRGPRRRLLPARHGGDRGRGWSATTFRSTSAAIPPTSTCSLSLSWTATWPPRPKAPAR